MKMAPFGTAHSRPQADPRTETSPPNEGSNWDLNRFAANGIVSSSEGFRVLRHRRSPTLCEEGWVNRLWR